MGYLYLTAALLAGLIKGFCGRTVSRSMQTFRECVFINLMRMLFCALIGLTLCLLQNGYSLPPVAADTVGIFLPASVSMSTFCVCWMYAYRNEAYMFLSIFTMLGTIVTCLLDVWIYHTSVRPNQWIGMGLLLAAVFIMSAYNRGIKGKLTAGGLAILVIGSVGSALADFSQKVYMREIGQGADIFNFYMYAGSFFLLLILYLLLMLADRSGRISPKLYRGTCMGIYFAMSFFLFVNSVTKTLAAGFLSAAQIYPVLQGANLILSAGMAHVLFREKINRKSVCGILTAFAGLMLMHML